MSTSLTRYKAECPGCGLGITDTSETFVQDAADVHQDECDQLEADQEIDVEEVAP